MRRMCPSPEVRSSSPAISRKRVDFPQPEGPTNTEKDPSSTVRSMPWITSSDWKLLWTPLSSSLAISVYSHHQTIAGLQRALPSEQDHVTVALSCLAVHGGCARAAWQPKFRHRQFAALHCQCHSRSFQFD